MSKYILLGLILLGFLSGTAEAGTREKKKKKGKTEAVAPKKSEYEMFREMEGLKTVSGWFITLHRLGDKIFFEYPLKYMERDLLIASTPAATSEPLLVNVGYKASTPMHVRFEQEDSVIFLCERNSYMTYDEHLKNREDVIRDNFMDVKKQKMKIVTYNTERTAVVFDVTEFFTDKNARLCPVKGYFMGLPLVGDLKKNLSTIGKIKAFDDNISIEMRETYACALRRGQDLIGLGDITVNTVKSVLLLPEKKMKPRLSDPRIGIFLTGKQNISPEEGSKYYSFANRWRLEPRDMKKWERGELVEPKKPIVYYLDNAFPEAWRKPLKRGILRWNKAFEAIGFKNAVQVRDFPLDDSAFDPDNLKYSCVRYCPAGIENAMGPSWVDPVTGEIVNASVIIYNDVVRLAADWRFVQTAQVDDSVRSGRLSGKVLEETLEYLVAHEVGHTLGLMHNMKASHAIPVDSLRSVAFTQKYGTTPSIMDYARFNYVAQPGDKGVRLTPPDLGIYDYFLVKWSYQPLLDAGDEWDEQATLEGWVDEKAGDPRYRYGRQQIYSRYDPSAIEEDLGDDPMKAGEYGIKNLKYILSNLNKWIQDDETAEYRQVLYGQIVSQYSRYLQNAAYCIGGIYLNDAKDGTAAKRYTPVPKAKQKAAVAWVIGQLQNNEWLDNREVCSKFGLHSKASATLNSAVADLLTKIYMNVTLSSYLEEKNPYAMVEFFNDLYVGVWDAAIRNRKLSHGDKVMQKAMVNMMGKSLTFIGGNKIGLTAISAEVAYAPSIQEICLYGLDETGTIARYSKELTELEAREGKAYMAEQMRLSGFGYGYGWQSPVTCDAIDESTTYYYDSALKIKSLLERRIVTTNPADKAHYQAMLFTINQMLGVN